MSMPVVCEPLDPRSYFAAAPSTGLDPDYLFSAEKVRRALGQDVPIFQALPAKGGRTYLLSVRPKDKSGDTHSGLLTLIAVNADGDLDRTFGKNGVAYTAREVVYQGNPGLLKVDGRGRIYFGESTRIIRFKADGSTDATFGRGGSADFATADRPVQLCDFTPTDDGGVLVATTSTTEGVQRFAVQKIAKKIRTTWQTSYATGNGADVDGRTFDVADGRAQFAASAGQIVLIRTQTVGKLVREYDSAAAETVTVFEASREDAIVTRFDAAGSGTDVASKELHFPTAIFTSVGSTGPAGFVEYKHASVGGTLLYNQGRSLLLLTEAELVRFDLATGRGRWIDLPETRRTNAVAENAHFELYPDGTIGATVYLDYEYSKASTAEIERFFVDGSKVTSFADGGVLTVKAGDYPVVKPDAIDRTFLGQDGRVYFIATGTNNHNYSTLTLRRN